MVRMVFAIAAMALLGACGVGGGPMRPGAEGRVAVGTGGVETSGRVFTTNGTLTIGVGL